MPSIQAVAPKGLNIDLLFDQSLFVRAAIYGVVHESMIAALLTATMILMFLGSWRSTLIVAVSIPLSILFSLTMLYWLGQTLNVMTLGGLSLAVGILVDDATVEIENIHRNAAMGKPLRQAILDGAQQIAGAHLRLHADDLRGVRLGDVPGRAAAIPLHAAGHGRGLRHAGLLPAVANAGAGDGRLPVAGRDAEQHWRDARPRRETPGPRPPPRGPFARFHRGFERLFQRTRDGYLRLLEWNLRHRRTVFGIFLAAAASGLLMLPYVGRDFFPVVDAGQFRLHVRAPAGTRVEKTQQYFSQVEEEIRRVIPADEVEHGVWTTSVCPTAAIAWPSATAPRSAWATGKFSWP